MGKIPQGEDHLNVSTSDIIFDLATVFSNEEYSSSEIFTPSHSSLDKASSQVLTSPTKETHSEDLTFYPEEFLINSEDTFVTSEENMPHLDYSFDIAELTDEPDHEWGMQNEDLWNNLDLDWLSKTELDLAEKVTTQDPVYSPKIYEQSTSVLIRVMGNGTDEQVAESLDRALEVGPWMVTHHQLPYLLGSLVGLCLLVILVTSLVLYICFHKRRTSEQYNVKSQRSSVSSDRTCPPSNNLSKDSLIVAGAAPNGHQARLYSDPTTTNNLLFDRNFDFYFTLPKADGPSDAFKSSKTYSEVNPELAPVTLHKDLYFKNQFPRHCESELKSDTKKRRFSTACEEMNCFLEDDLKRGNSLKEITTEGKIGTGRKRPRREYSKSVCSQGISFKDQKNIQGRYENLKTNSLPSWARNKQSVTKDKLLFMVYDKCCDISTKRMQRNRMGSDAAQIIALSKSNNPLINNTDNGKEDVKNCYDGGSICNCHDDEALINSNVVIIYNERTAL